MPENQGQTNGSTNQAIASQPQGNGMRDALQARADAAKAAAAPAATAAPDQELTKDQQATPEPAVLGDGQQTQKEGEKAVVPDKVAADIEIKLPEGFEADSGLIDRFKATAKEQGLDSAKAQKLFDLYADASTSFNARLEESAKAQVSDWGKQSRSDKEFGGQKYDANLQIAEAGLKQYGTDKLRNVLTQLGLHAHPEVIRLFYRIGQANKEDTAAGTMNHRGQLTAEQSREQMYRAMFPNSPEMFSKSNS